MEKVQEELFKWEKNRANLHQQDNVQSKKALKTLMMQLIYSQLVQEMDEFTDGELPVKF